eukprot:CAMPEP_0174884790 /NCGR_PEP_ID=MMETSP0167-20121228/212_1 /TAXON_ID=38298 /ORGANISM="Rhodella maculata, Strain CCMP736" /LENGTH=81 /DNA_ID=CAMNT_0016120233 /DNA_START=370 /DNA_END=611 /DNA_ORIENTATION=+
MLYIVVVILHHLELKRPQPQPRDPRHAPRRDPIPRQRRGHPRHAARAGRSAREPRALSSSRARRIPGEGGGAGGGAEGGAG